MDVMGIIAPRQYLEANECSMLQNNANMEPTQESTNTVGWTFFLYLFYWM